MKNAIRLIDLSVTFRDGIFNRHKVQALQHLNVTIEQGETFGIIGPSGAGKTTLLKVLTKQIDDYSGQILFAGQNIKTIKKDFFKAISIFSVDSGLYMDLSVYDNLILYANVYQKGKAEVNELLKKTGLVNVGAIKMNKLSTGMLQRVSLIRCFLNGADILLLDEPTSNVDPLVGKYIRDIILEIKESGKTILIATHNMNEADLLCDQLLFLHKGQILNIGTSSEIKVEADHDVLRVTCKSINGTKTQFILPNQRKQLADFLKKEDILTIHSNEPTLEDAFAKLIERKNGE
ncbi:ABC transporter ATP-binding protein [Pediococcus acidilactici]